MPEFHRRALEVLRQPLEDGHDDASRAPRAPSVFPARFLLVGAMNPCPCGFRGHPARECRCTPLQVARYAGRLSGPLRDRLDLIVEVPAVPSGAARAPPRRASRRRCARAGASRRERSRQSGTGAGAGRINAELDGRLLARLVRPRRAASRLLAAAADAAGAQRARLRPRAQGGAHDCGSRRRRAKSGEPHAPRRSSIGRHPAVTPGLRVFRSELPSGFQRSRAVVELSRQFWTAAAAVRSHRLLFARLPLPRRLRRPSRRYTIVLADRHTGVYRRFTSTRGPWCSRRLALFALPVLVGLGLRWSAQSRDRAAADDAGGARGREPQLPGGDRRAHRPDAVAADGHRPSSASGSTLDPHGPARHGAAARRS